MLKVSFFEYICIYDDNPAPHCDRSYFGFLFIKVYTVTDAVATAVERNALITVLLLNKDETIPTSNASHKVKIVNKFHFIGDDCLACSDTDMAIIAPEEIKAHSVGTIRVRTI